MRFYIPSFLAFFEAKGRLSGKKWIFRIAFFVILLILTFCSVGSMCSHSFGRRLS
jgi:hypothetical protein